MKYDCVTENISSADEDKTGSHGEKQSAPVPEDNKTFFLNKTLATPAVRRMAMENNVRLCLIYFYMKEQNYFLNFCSEFL